MSPLKEHWQSFCAKLQNKSVDGTAGCYILGLTSMFKQGTLFVFLFTLLNIVNLGFGLSETSEMYITCSCILFFFFSIIAWHRIKVSSLFPWFKIRSFGKDTTYFSVMRSVKATFPLCRKRGGFCSSRW